MWCELGVGFWVFQKNLINGRKLLLESAVLFWLTSSHCWPFISEKKFPCHLLNLTSHTYTHEKSLAEKGSKFISERFFSTLLISFLLSASAQYPTHTETKIREITLPLSKKFDVRAFISRGLINIWILPMRCSRSLKGRDLSDIWKIIFNFI